MFTKMRAIIAAERSRADETEKQFAEYRQQDKEERRRAEEERRQERETLMAALAEERRRSDGERRLLQQQATENQPAFMAALTELTAHLAQQRNGSNGDVPNGA